MTDATGFHAGELAVQSRAGVAAEARRLSHMVEPTELGDGQARFLADRTFAAVTARDAAGVLWTSPLSGPPGFLRVLAPDILAIRTAPVPGDPLHDAPTPQPAGLIVLEPAARRRIRINGTLGRIDATTLAVQVEQAYGNCPQYIHRRTVAFHEAGPDHATDVRTGTSLAPDDVELIRAADTFFLGTTHPDRGNDASHRGGPPGFVRVDGNELWWPDLPGNNVFNSFGNLTVDPTAAMLFADFDSGRTLQLSGSATVEWDGPDTSETGRSVRFTVHHVVAGTLLGTRTAVGSEVLADE
jgi:predicted pyridoxine 5'-phosphate oxidase superfamily flavin-nucleotide-binding protein